MSDDFFLNKMVLTLPYISVIYRRSLWKFILLLNGLFFHLLAQFSYHIVSYPFCWDIFSISIDWAEEMFSRGVLKILILSFLSVFIINFLLLTKMWIYSVRNYKFFFCWFRASLFFISYETNILSMYLCNCEKDFLYLEKNLE